MVTENNAIYQNSKCTYLTVHPVQMKIYQSNTQAGYILTMS